MCLVKRKQSLTSLFHVQIGRSESIRDFMKRFEGAILKLKPVSPDMILQVVKQAIHSNTQFFYSLSLHPPSTIDELFQMGNQYEMLDDDVVAATKRTVASTSDVGRYSGNKGKISQDDQDRQGKRDFRESR